MHTFTLQIEKLVGEFDKNRSMIDIVFFVVIDSRDFFEGHEWF